MLFFLNIFMSLHFIETNHFYITNLTVEHSGIMKFLVVALELPPLPEGGPTSSTKEGIAVHFKIQCLTDFKAS